MDKNSGCCGLVDNGIPLVVDLDFTLLRTDLLAEGVCALVASNPLTAARLPIWMAGGKAALKARIADHATPDIATLPFNETLLAVLRDERASGRRLYLASASDRRYVEAVAAHVGLFDGVFASDGTLNLRGARKAEHLVDAFGDKGYDYAGDARIDLPVWRHARRAIGVNVPPDLARTLARDHPDHRLMGTRTPPWRSSLTAMRPHQWAKNILLAVPALAAHQMSAETMGVLILAFAAISMVASATYLINDLLDLPHDRCHATKRFRPLAAGHLPLTHGLVIAPGLVVLGALTAALVSWSYLGMVALYFATTLAYSTVLKRRMLVDVLTLAGLYTLRILAGGVAAGVTVSAWLLGVSVFLFLCLAIVKRYTELAERLRAGAEGASGRGYRTDDLPVLSALGGAAGYSAVTVLALYINSPSVAGLYGRPEVLWLICPLLLYWVSRMLMLAHRGQMHDDPVVFALRDRVSLACGAIIAVIVGLAI